LRLCPGEPLAPPPSPRPTQAKGSPPCPVQAPRGARPSPAAVPAPKRAGRTVPGRAGPGPPRARRARRRMRSGTACAPRSTWSFRERMPPNSPASRRRCSRSWRPWARSRPCWPGASRSPPGIARADQIEAELFEEHHHPGGGRGLALIRDGNGPRSFETLLRYRGAALAEFWRALRTLKALQAEQALETAPAPEAHPLAARPPRPAPRSPLVQRPQPDEPERGAGPRPECPARASRPWLPSEPETGARLACGVAAHPTACRTNPIRSAFEDLTEPNPHDPTGPEVILSYEP
jgi:hypothetical protein